MPYKFARKRQFFNMDQKVDTGYKALCCTCLSSDRNVTSLNELSSIYKIFRLIMYDFDSDRFGDAMKDLEQLVCWECLAMMKKFARFKQQVHNAQEYLYEQMNESWEATDHTYISQTLSPLTLVTKNDYDTIIYNNIQEDHDFSIENDWQEGYIKPEDIKDETVDIIPLLKDHGIEDEVIEELIQDNSVTSVIVVADTNTDSMFKTKVKKEPPDGTDTENQIYTCEYCGEMFEWRKAFIKHLISHKPKKTNKQRTNEMQSTTYSDSYRKLTDTESELTRSDNQNAEMSSSEKKTNGQYVCTQCDKVFLWRWNMFRHMRSHAAKENGDLICKPCNKTFSSIATYKQHMKISKKHVTESDFKFMCSDCGRRFPTKTRLTDHINWEHLKNYLYKCDECHKVFESSSSMYLHKQRKLQMASK